MIFLWRKGQLVKLVSLNKLLTVSMIQIVLLSVTNIAEMALFYLNWPVLMIFPYRKGQLVQMVSLNKVLTVSMLQIVLSV